MIRTRKIQPLKIRVNERKRFASFELVLNLTKSIVEKINEIIEVVNELQVKIKRNEEKKV